MADNEIGILVKTTDQTKPGYDSAAAGAEGMASKVGGSISKLGQTIGGEVGEIVGQFGEGFDKIAESGTSALTKVGAGGAVVAGLGVALQSFASKGEAAENQLKAAVNASGQSWDDYEGKVNKAISTEAKYAHGAADTDTALQTLYSRTGDMDTALGDLNVTTDLAAAKHESLATAAQQIAAIYGGNEKILKQYGITIGENTDGTKDFQGAIDQLGQKLAGQADAQADTFSGKVAGIKTEIENAGDKVAGFIGGPLTMLGTVTSAVTGVMEISASAISLVKGRHGENTVATLADSSAQTRLAETAGLAAAAETDLAAATRAQAGAAGAASLANTGWLAKMGAFGPVSAGIVGGALLESTALSQAKDAAKKHGDAMGVATFAQSMFSMGTSTLAQKVADYIPWGHKGSDATKKQKDAFDDAGASALANAAATNEASAANDILQGSATALGLAETNLATDIKNQATALDGLQGQTLDNVQANLQFQDSLSSLTAQVKQETAAHALGAQTLDTNTDAGRANAESILGMVKAAQQQVENGIKQGQSVDTVTKAYAGNVSQIEATAEQAGISKAAIDAYITKLKATPKDIHTTLTSQVIIDQASLARAQAAIKSAAINIRVTQINAGRYTGGNVGAAATGGDRSGALWVGEHGPELVDLPGGSHVNSNPDSMSRGGGQAQIVRVQLEWAPGSGQDGPLLEALRKMIRIRGGDVQYVLGR